MHLLEVRSQLVGNVSINSDEGLSTILQIAMVSARSCDVSRNK
jgi:hypothetical protein